MSFRKRTNRSRALVAAVLSLGVWGCSARIPPSARVPRTETGGAELFDDVIEASAVGLELEWLASSPRDAHLSERARSGAFVVRVRVETFTARGDENHERYELGLRVLQTIAGAHSLPQTFSVRIPSEGDSAAIAKLLGGRLFGMTFIAFVRQSIQPEGDLEFRFHLSKDDAAVSTAVLRAVKGRAESGEQ